MKQSVQLKRGQRTLTWYLEKIEADLITKCCKRNYACLQIGNRIVTFKSIVKYAEAMIKMKLSYKHHLQYACDKLSMTSMSQAGMTPRYLIASVVSSFLFYAAPVWKKALQVTV